MSLGVAQGHLPPNARTLARREDPLGTPLSGIDGTRPIRAVESQPKGVNGKTGMASLRPAREADKGGGDEFTFTL